MIHTFGSESPLHHRGKRLAAMALGHKKCWITVPEECVQPATFNSYGNAGSVDLYASSSRKRPDALGIGPTLIRPRSDRCISMNDNPIDNVEFVAFSVEVKVSLTDLKNGFNDGEGHYNYLMVTVPLLPKALDLIPPHVGLFCMHGPTDGDGYSRRWWYTTERRATFNEECWLPVMDPTDDPWIRLLLHIGRKATWDSYTRDANAKKQNGKKHAPGVLPWRDAAYRNRSEAL